MFCSFWCTSLGPPWLSLLLTMSTVIHVVTDVSFPLPTPQVMQNSNRVYTNAFPKKGKEIISKFFDSSHSYGSWRNKSKHLCWSRVTRLIKMSLQIMEDEVLTACTDISQPLQSRRKAVNSWFMHVTLLLNFSSISFHYALLWFL